MKNSSQGPEVKRGGGPGPGSRREPERRGDTPAAASLLALQSTLGDAGAGDEAKAAALQQVPPDRRVAVIRGVNDALGNRQAQRVVAAAPSASAVAPRRVERSTRAPARARGGASGKGEVREEEPDELGDRVLAPRGFAAPPPGDGEPRGPSRARAGGAALLRQRAGEPGLDDLVAGAEERALARRTVGAPLPEPLRAMLEEHMECDLGDVRIHTDDTAADLARDVGARAFTVGLDISFARGAFAPQTAAGLALLVHEVKHVEQHQRGLQPSELLPGHAIAAPHDHLEREADAAAQRIVAGALSQGRVARPASASAAPSRRHRRASVNPGAVIMRTEGVGSTNPNYPVGAIRHIRTEIELPIGYVKADKFGKAKGRVNALKEHNKLPVDTRVKVTSAAGAAIEVEVTPTDDLGGAQTYAGKEGVIPQSTVTDPTQESKRTPKKPAPIVVAAPKTAAAANAAPFVAEVKPAAAAAKPGAAAAKPAAPPATPETPHEVNDICHTKGRSQLPVAIGSTVNRLGGTTELPVGSKIKILEIHAIPKNLTFKVKVLESGDPTVKPDDTTEGFLRSVFVNTRKQEAERDGAGKPSPAGADAKKVPDGAASTDAPKPADPAMTLRHITKFDATTIFLKKFWEKGEQAPKNALDGGKLLPVNTVIRLVGEPQTRVAGQTWYNIVVADVGDDGQLQASRGASGILRIENFTTLAQERERRAKAAALAPKLPEPDQVQEIANAPGFVEYYKALLELLEKKDYKAFFSKLDSAGMDYILYALNRILLEQAGYAKLSELVTALKDASSRGNYSYDRVHAALFITHLTSSPKGTTISSEDGDAIILEVARIKFQDQIDLLKNRLNIFKEQNEGSRKLLYRLRGESMPRMEDSESNRGQFIAASPQGVIPKGTRVDYMYVDNVTNKRSHYGWYISKVGVPEKEWSRDARGPEESGRHFRFVWDEDPGHYVVHLHVKPWPTGAFGTDDPSSPEWFDPFWLTYDQEIVSETDDRSILGQAHRAGTVMTLQELQEAHKAAAQELLDMGTPKDQRDPAHPNQPYIQLVKGNNPTTLEGAGQNSNTYTISAVSDQVVNFNWFVQGKDITEDHPLVSKHKYRFGTLGGAPTVFLDDPQFTVELPLDREEVLAIYCEQLDASDETVAVTQYLQTITDYRTRDKVRAQSDKLLKAASDEVDQLHETSGWQRKVVPLKATHLDGRTGVVRSGLRLFMDLRSDTYYLDRNQSMTGRQIVVPQFRIIDLEHPSQDPYTGKTVEDAIASFKSKNKFTKGRIRITVPPVEGWIDTKQFPNGAMWDIETSGETDAEVVGKWAGRVSIGTMLAGVALMSVAAPFGLALTLIGALSQSIVHGASIYEELQKKKPDPLKIAIDVGGIATSMVSVLHSSTRLAIEKALKFGQTELQIVLAHSAESYRILENVVGMGTSLLIVVDKIPKIADTLSKKHLSAAEMQLELKAIFWELVESGAMILLQRHELMTKPKLPQMPTHAIPEPGTWATAESPLFPAAKSPAKVPARGAPGDIHGPLVPVKKPTKASPWVTADPPTFGANGPNARKVAGPVDPGELHANGTAGGPPARAQAPDGTGAVLDGGGPPSRVPPSDGVGVPSSAGKPAKKYAPDGTLISEVDPVRQLERRPLKVQNDGAGDRVGLRDQTPKRDRPDVPAAAGDDVAALAHGNQVQEAAWGLRERGLPVAAAAQEKFLEGQLAHGKITRMEPLGGGVTKTYLVTFDDGVTAVFKPDFAGNKGHLPEVAAYRMSRALGFDYVPVTIERKISFTTQDGQAVSLPGSLQYHVKSSASGADLGSRFYKPPPEFGAFDYVINNVDRTANPGNWLVMPGGRKIAIDHGTAFLPKDAGAAISDEALKALMANPTAAARFKTTGHTGIHEALDGYIPADKISEVTKRYDQVVERMDAVAASGGLPAPVPAPVGPRQVPAAGPNVTVVSPGVIKIEPPGLMGGTRQTDIDRAWGRWAQDLGPAPMGTPPDWLGPAMKEKGLSTVELDKLKAARGIPPSQGGGGPARPAMVVQKPVDVGGTIPPPAMVTQPPPHVSGQGPGGVAPPAMVTQPPPYVGGQGPGTIPPPAMVTQPPPHVGDLGGQGPASVGPPSSRKIAASVDSKRVPAAGDIDHWGADTVRGPSGPPSAGAAPDPVRAAILGDAEVQQALPNLGNDFKIVSAPSPKYNCIAHSMGVQSEWIPPMLGSSNQPFSYMDTVYSGHGYTRSSGLDLTPKPGTQKVVVFGTRGPDGAINDITHAVRLEPNGKWTSKLGAGPVIEHDTLGHVQGGAYGEPVAVYEKSSVPQGASAHTADLEIDGAATLRSGDPGLQPGAAAPPAPPPVRVSVVDAPAAPASVKPAAADKPGAPASVKPDAAADKPGTPPSQPPPNSELPMTPAPVKKKKAGLEFEQLTTKGRNDPVPLTKDELLVVDTWSEMRNQYLKKWWQYKGAASFSPASKLLFESSVERAIRKAMTPDDLAAVLKERRGVKILDASGGVFNHLTEATHARNSLRKGIGKLKERLSELYLKPAIAQPGEIEALHAKLKDLSDLLDFYGKYK